MDEIEIIGEVVRPQKRKRGRPPIDRKVFPSKKKLLKGKHRKGRRGRKSVLDIGDGSKGSCDGTRTSSLTATKHSEDSGQQLINGNCNIEFENETTDAVSSTAEITTQETDIVLPLISSVTSKSAAIPKNPSTPDYFKDPTTCSSENLTEGSTGSKSEILERNWEPVKQVASLASDEQRQGQQLDLVEFLGTLSELKQGNRMLEERFNNLKQRRDQLIYFNDAIGAPIDEGHTVEHSTQSKESEENQGINTQEHEQNIHGVQSKELEENQDIHIESSGENNNEEHSAQFAEIIQNGSNENEGPNREYVSLEQNQNYSTVGQLPVLFVPLPHHQYQQMISGLNSSASTDIPANEVSNNSETQPEQSTSSAEQPNYFILGVFNFSMELRMENPQLIQ